MATQSCIIKYNYVNMLIIVKNAKNKRKIMSKNHFLLAFLCSFCFTLNVSADYIDGQRAYASGDYELLYLNGLKLHKMEMLGLNIIWDGCMQTEEG